jgi:4-alpha-glucanotransferase
MVSPVRVNALKPARKEGEMLIDGDVERVESELNRLIDKRAEASAVERAEREREAAYAESCRRFYAKRDEQLAAAHLEHHQRMLASHAATFEAIAAHHRAERDRYLHILGHALPGESAAETGPETA